MKKYEFLSILFFWLASIVFIFIAFFHFSGLSYVSIYSLINGDVMETPTFLQINENLLKETEYKANSWDCDDISYEYIDRLRQQGYIARMVHGKYNNTCHAWVEIKIMVETTSGKIITPQKFEELYSFDYNNCKKEYFGLDNFN